MAIANGSKRIYIDRYRKPLTGWPGWAYSIRSETVNLCVGAICGKEHQVQYLGLVASHFLVTWSLESHHLQQKAPFFLIKVNLNVTNYELKARKKMFYNRQIDATLIIFIVQQNRV